MADKTTYWNGIRNYAARNFMREMRKGDEAFFYHSNEGKEIVGIVQITKESYQDPTTTNDAWVVVDVKPLKKLKFPVSLQTLKTVEEVSQMVLLNNTRLSVQPVTEDEWKAILKLSGTKAHK